MSNNIPSAQDFEDDDNIDFGDSGAPNLSVVPSKPNLVDVKDMSVEDADIAMTDFSEQDLARIFVKRYHDTWRFIDEWGAWMEWSDSRWIENKRRGFMGAVQSYMDGVIHWPSYQRQQETVRKAIKTRRVEANVREKIKDSATMNDVKEIFDADDYLIGTPGGVIDLHKGVFRPAKREDYITKRTAVAPKKSPTPHWDKHLDFVCKGDAELKHYLHKLFGYLLCGDRREQCFTFFFGHGGNGKGAMMRQVVGILGDYACEVNASTFMEQRSPAHLSELARLEGCRLAYIDETPKGTILNEERVQKFTGGSKIVANRMHKDPYEFTPKCYLVLLGNFKPILKTTGPSMARRTHLFPCLNSVAPEQQDHTIEDKMREEWAGILWWMLEGFKLWSEEGLKKNMPKAIAGSTRDYLDAEDSVADWLIENCERGNPDSRTNRTLLYTNFKRWNDKQGNHYIMNNRSFFEDLESKGFQKMKSNGINYFRGIEIKQDSGTPGWGDD